jgi:hypothetical protein
MKPSEVLLKIKRNPFKIFIGYGICGLYASIRRTNDYADLANTIQTYGIDLKEFPLYSGRDTYPVYNKTPDDAHRSYVLKIKWNPFSRYGRNRRAYLDWLIVEFQKRGG